MSTDASTIHEPAPLTVVVRRRIRPGSDEGFEAAMREFIQFALSFPGHEGITVLRPEAGGRDYLVVHKFRDVAARREFTVTPQYQHWMGSLADLTDGDARIQELTGLEGWFTVPGHPDTPPPSPLKMAVATFLGAYPVGMLLNLTIGPTVAEWPFLVSNAVFNVGMVGLLTWVVMPAITRLLSPWLFADKGVQP